MFYLRAETFYLRAETFLRAVTFLKCIKLCTLICVCLLLVLYPRMDNTAGNIVSRPVRTRQTPMIYTPSKTEICSVKKVDYTLNEKKTLQKKLEATEREWNVKAENKLGTVVLEFTPAPYEAFKQSVKSYYEQCNKNRVRIDENRYKVDESLSFLDGKGDKRKNQLFRISFYNTTSRVTVNGKCLTLFTDNDLPKILNDLAKILHFSSLNKCIADACVMSLQSLPSRSYGKKPLSSSQTHDSERHNTLSASSTTEPLMIAGSDDTTSAVVSGRNSFDEDSGASGSTTDTLCTICDKNIIGDIHAQVLCNECDMLFHRGCVKST